MPYLAYYLHDLNPIIFQFWFIKTRWYGFAYLMGFLGAYLLISKLAHDGMLRLNPARIPDMVLNCCIFGVLVGGRLGYCLFYKPELLLFSGEFPYWGVLRVWEGGMSAHGGIIFTILTLMIFAWRQHDPQLHLWDIIKLPGGAVLLGGAGWAAGYFLFHDVSIQVSFAIILAGAWIIFYAWRKAIPVTNIGDAACMVVPVGLCFGRIANFINGELYGHVTTVPWAVKFPSEIWSPTNDTPDLTAEQLTHLREAVAQFVDTHASQMTPADIQAFLGNHADLAQSLTYKIGPLHLDRSADQLASAQQWLSGQLALDPATVVPGDLARWWEHSNAALHDFMYHLFDTTLPPRHPSQLYEALLEGVLLFLICWTIGRLWRKDGMASGAFLTFYPIMRITGEQFRVGDTPINIGGHLISKGVLYSLPLVLAGALYWIYWIRKDRRIPWVRVATDGSQAAAAPPSTAPNSPSSPSRPPLAPSSTAPEPPLAPPSTPPPPASKDPKSSE